MSYSNHAPGKLEYIPPSGQPRKLWSIFRASRHERPNASECEQATSEASLDGSNMKRDMVNSNIGAHGRSSGYWRRN
jgi:hypothetical protein